MSVLDLTLARLEDASKLVHELVSPTPQHRWPLIEEAVGTETWLKHENHTPVGAFKVRGGIVYLHHLMERERPTGLVSATRGNHGQSIATAAARHEVPVTIVVPHGNSREKNRAMRAQGATLVEHGDDFQEALEHAGALAEQHGWHLVPSFHPDLVAGVASYPLELLRAVPGLDVIYVPIGLGSGVCATLAARDALGLNTRVVGVVSAGAPAYAHTPGRPASRSRPPSPPSSPTAWPVVPRTPTRSRSSVPVSTISWRSTTTQWRQRCRCCSPPLTTWPRAPEPPRSRPPCKNATPWLVRASASSSPAATSTSTALSVP